MGLWNGWLEILGQLIGMFASLGPVGTGVAVILTTLLLRSALLPIAWPIAYRARVRQMKLLELQPKLQELRERLKDKPDLYMTSMLDLYRRHDLTLIDGRGIMGALLQLPVFVGMFHVLRDGIAGGRFLWIANLAKPDALFAIAAGLTTALMMAVIPEVPEHLRTFMLVLPSILVAVVAFKFSAALCLYWVTSNSFSALQTLWLNRHIDRQIRLGTLKV
jgi:YidC/Oxa1 family membrane protein insertase